MKRTKNILTKIAASESKMVDDNKCNFFKKEIIYSDEIR